MAEQGLPVMFLRVLRAATIVCATIVVLIMVIEVWKRWLIGLGQRPVAGDYVFFAVLVGLLLGLIFLVRAISRELRRSRGS